MKLNHTFSALHESIDLENQITINDTTVVNKLLQTQGKKMTVAKMKEYWDAANLFKVKIPLDEAQTVINSIKLLEQELE